MSARCLCRLVWWELGPSPPSVPENFGEGPFTQLCREQHCDAGPLWRHLQADDTQGTIFHESREQVHSRIQEQRVCFCSASFL